MLAWISRKLTHTDDSLGAAAGLRAFLDALPMDKPALALDDISERIAGAAELGLKPAACRFELKKLDDAAQDLQARLWNGLFNDVLGASISDANWRALANYERNVFCGYKYCLDQLPAPDRLDPAERSDALLLAGRAMAALASHKTLMCIRYRVPHADVWSDADALFARAQHYDLAQSPVRLYPATVQQTTVEREYISALLLDAALTGNLLPTQTYCLHLLLRQFSERYHFADNFAPKAPFFIEPANCKPPQRWREGLTPQPGARFFGFGDAYSLLDGLRAETKSSSTPPKWAQASRVDGERFVALIDTLVAYWSAHPPQRRSRRERQVAAVLATHGFAQVYRVIAYSRFSKEGRQLKYDDATSQDLVAFGKAYSIEVELGNPTPERPLTPMETLQTFEHKCDPQSIERWSVLDTSEGGLGAIAERHNGWLRAGMLVGFRYHDDIEWRIGTVRRLYRTAQGKLGVGLKCPALIVGCARLRISNVTAGGAWLAVGAGDVAYADAILVGGEQPLLIAAPGTYAPARECVMSVDKSARNIRFVNLVEQGIDFECIAFAFTTTD